ncbi:hypothetical protein AWB78_07353 [Caballeronia calidae]|uniref:Uncharacterized protein n=1 Tax=Caballeronia calidae TaxID=1777139 RepID=A0A158EEC3_9BURK|nr:hypothetical protein [Caballeronia calidae]SAL05198.1 hypothetical protein AWB78_07353 [Caballeronia calidae]
MFEETLLRFADKDRQRELAEREQALTARQASLHARQQNLAFRQSLIAQHPQAVLDAIQTDDAQRASNKAHDEQARVLKARFGLTEHELVDTPAMRLALETALAEKEVEQTQRGERIADRASLLAGLNKLALIDSRKVAEILQATKQINPPREWSRAETAQMFANAMSWKTPSGATKTYPKTLDGWATSLQERTRALELAEIKLDAQEQALRAQVRRAIEEAQKTVAHPIVEQAAKNGAEQAVETTATRTLVGNEKESVRIDTSAETLKDPARYAATVEAIAKTSGKSTEEARATLESLLEIREAGARRASSPSTPDKAAIDATRDAFFARESAARTAPVEQVKAKSSATRSQVRDTGEARQPQPPSSGILENGLQKAAASQPSDAVTGFKKLGRNKTKDAVDRSTHVAGKPVEPVRQQQAVRTGNGQGKAEARKKFSELNAHEKIERRAEFLGDLREAAGFTRDGKQAVSEKAKEAVRPGKQREGHGIG